jgi:hypothetical protein
MKTEIESINKQLDALIKANKSHSTPTAELNTEINGREAYLFANREAFLQIARACLNLASEDLDGDGAHIHLDIGDILFKINMPLALELRNDWGE